MKNGIALLIIFCAFTSIKAQNFTAKEQTLQAVFNNLVTAYGNAKTAPSLVLLPNNKADKIIAQYFTIPSPIIKVDEKLFDLCLSMGADSLNALSIILSHELAHYYNEHNWCSDFSFAIRNTTLGKQIVSETKDNNVSHEKEADNFGLYHSCLAGYKPFDIYSKLINKIYIKYRLPEKMKGYPSKSERILIGKDAEERIAKLYPKFIAGLASIKKGNYDTAITCFEDLNKYFPSRENYNNLGIAKTLCALKLKQSQLKEFEYPLEIDYSSRLNINNSRGIDDEPAQKTETILKSAKSDFEKAISLDSKYTNAYMNLACVYDLLGNQDAALGVLNDLGVNNDRQTQLTIIMLKAIAYYHHDNDKKLHETLVLWQDMDSTFYSNNLTLLKQ